MDKKNDQTDKVILVYDKECPACHFYCQRVEIKDQAGTLELVDARDKSDIMDEITQAGMDIDQGMVLKKDGTMYYGSEAISKLANIGRSKGLFNRFNAFVFRSRRISKILYPILKSVRNVLLKILGKTKINNLKNKNSSHF